MTICKKDLSYDIEIYMCDGLPFRVYLMSALTYLKLSDAEKDAASEFI